MVLKVKFMERTKWRRRRRRRTVRRKRATGRMNQRKVAMMVTGQGKMSLWKRK